MVIVTAVPRPACASALPAALGVIMASVSSVQANRRVLMPLHRLIHSSEESMTWHNSSLATSRQDRYAPTPGSGRTAAHSL
jgi:hypothetical protein